MSDDTIVRGTELDAADLRVESSSTNSFALGLALLGVAAWLGGPLLALANLPGDLSTATAATFEPAVPVMAIGFVLVFAGGLVALVTSDPVVGGLERLQSLWRDDPDPIPDGGNDE